MFERYFLCCTLHKAYFETLIGHVEFLFLLCERRRDWIWFMFVKSYICACKKRASRGNQRLLVDCFHHPNQRKFAYIEVRVPNTWRYLYFSRKPCLIGHLEICFFSDSTIETCFALCLLKVTFALVHFIVFISVFWKN